MQVPEFNSYPVIGWTLGDSQNNTVVDGYLYVSSVIFLCNFYLWVEFFGLRIINIFKAFGTC